MIITAASKKVFVNGCFMTGTYYGSIGRIPTGITSNNRMRMIVAYNSIYCEVVTFGKDAEAPVFCFPIWPYHSLPNFLPVLHNWMVDLVWSAGGLPLLTMSPIWV